MLWSLHWVVSLHMTKSGGRKRVGRIKVTKFQHRPALVIFNLFTVDKNILHKLTRRRAIYILIDANVREGSIYIYKRREHK